MAVFEYQAMNAKGKQQRGVIEADSAKQARQLIREQGLSLLSVEEVSEKLKKQSQRISLFQKRISSKEVMLITRQLATLIAASLPIEEALKTVAQQNEKGPVSSLISAIRNKVLEGHSLAEAMATFPHVFDKLYRAMIAAGEASGYLDLVLERLADYTEKRQLMKQKMVQAMIYPIVLTCVAIAVVAILLAAVVPQMVEQFIHMKQSLPVTTQILIALSDFVKTYGIVVLLLIIIIIFTIKRLLIHPQRRLKWDKRLLQLPLIGSVVKGQNTARYAHTLSILNSSAVPLLQAMRISSEVLTNSYMQQQLLQSIEWVREGSSLNIALAKTQLFPPMMLHMIASGEQSGKLDDMLNRAAENQDKEFSAQVTMVLTIFEPLLVVTMACVVLFIVLSILQPMLQLNQFISG